MLETFKARLKAKSTAAGANLSQKRIDAKADKLHAKFPDLTDEAEHDAKIDDVFDEQDFKDLAAADDFQRTKEAKEKKDKADKDKADKDKADKDKPGAEDEPAWFKKYREESDAKINGLIAEKQQQSLTEKLSKHEKLKDIPAKFYNKRVMPKTDEEIEAFAEEAAADYSELVPAQTDQPFRPGLGSKTKAITAPTKEEISRLTAAILPK